MSTPAEKGQYLGTDYQAMALYNEAYDNEVFQEIEEIAKQYVSPLDEYADFMNTVIDACLGMCGNERYALSAFWLRLAMEVEHFSDDDYNTVYDYVLSFDKLASFAVNVSYRWVD